MANVTRASAQEGLISGMGTEGDGNARAAAVAHPVNGNLRARSTGRFPDIDRPDISKVPRVVSRHLRFNPVDVIGEVKVHRPR
jgi:hypothetical protein